MVKDGARRDRVQSLERAFELLDLMAAAGGETSLTQLSGSSGLPLPTAHRILRTLVANGYARQLPSRRYALGAHLIRLGEVSARRLSTWAEPELARLVTRLGETANMAMLDGHKAVYVAQVPSEYSLRMSIEVGRRVLLHNSGVGKALLAQMSPAAIDEAIEALGLPARTERTITDKATLLRVLDETRERGYAVDDEEQELGVRCVSVPVTGVPGAVTAISISGPSARLTHDVIQQVAPILKESAHNLSVHFAAEFPEVMPTVKPLPEAGTAS